MSPSSPRKISRRATLAWVAAAAAGGSALAMRHALTGPVIAVPGGARLAAFIATAGGYGSDPDLNRSMAPWPRLMSEGQLTMVSRLADLILPATASAPAPSELGIEHFVDEWISAPYPDQLHDRGVILKGLGRVAKVAAPRWGRDIAFFDSAENEGLMAALATRDGPSLLGDKGLFFRRLRFIVTGAYFSTPEGFSDIGYVGNVARDSFPAPDPGDIAILEEELRKLGL